MGINLRPDLEERLTNLASAKGLSVDAFIQQVIDERFAFTSSRRLSPDEWAQQFEAWADSFSQAPLIPDEALSRENLYPDRL